MNPTKLILISGVVSVLAACGSTQSGNSSPVASNIPDWVLNPYAEDGIAATDCVRFTGNLSVDSKMAAANSRVALAQQIETRVEALDKTYSNRTDSNDESTVGTTFSSVSKQVSKQTLNGARVVKTDIVNIAGKDHVCSKMELNPGATQQLLETLITKSERKINPQDQKFLYQEFKAYKAEQDLAAEIERLTN
ncbi:LPP20 family lipoprotein [Catenovulum sediminis]|uniref:LPP20 family lipoprotein n=1 Tax=Catenovulum sediminis TaxID=1740262 RepID=A0ABV1RMQ3_9ALTE|nr:LPP20 family lipoprotein [Catenovulum sediminis]